MGLASGNSVARRYEALCRLVPGTAPVIRVAFVIEGQSFLGSINYFRNLFSALMLLPDRKLQPLLFVGTQTSDKILGNFRHAEIVRTKLLDERTLAARVRRRLSRMCHEADPALSLLLAFHNIQVLSHFGPLWRIGIKTIGWIPDFQHFRLPQFFSEKERLLRDENFNRITHDCDCILLSSFAAQSDLAAFAPETVGKSRVLRFIPEVNATTRIMPVGDLQKKYGFHIPYFYMPNQFWIHKNHRIVVDALIALRDRGISATVLMTGSTEDYRYPDHYAELMARVERNGLTESFKVLGLVPYEDLLSLMHHSMAVINPSLFEGWSSTVEEAKALGKVVLLSNLPVHLEQNPAKGVFFDPAKAEDLAGKMLEIMKKARLDVPDEADLVYSDSYQADRLNFAGKYQEIVLDLVRGGQ
jgi:glycosyltransferase involved in cell wall biosynthesis